MIFNTYFSLQRDWHANVYPKGFFFLAQVFAICSEAYKEGFGKRLSRLRIWKSASGPERTGGENIYIPSSDHLQEKACTPSQLLPASSTWLSSWRYLKAHHQTSPGACLGELGEVVCGWEEAWQSICRQSRIPAALLQPCVSLGAPWLHVWAWLCFSDASPAWEKEEMEGPEASEQKAYPKRNYVSLPALGNWPTACLSPFSLLLTGVLCTLPGKTQRWWQIISSFFLGTAKIIFICFNSILANKYTSFSPVGPWG